MGTPKAVGIDLGTTNTVVAYLDASGRTAMIPAEQGTYLTPSVVRFSDGEIVVGREAQRLAVLRPEEVARWVKREMGAAAFSRPIRGQHLPPEVIQACILRKVRDDIIREIGPNARCVITVPAYFDEPRRKATADAGEMAGLRVVDIVNEPTAAAIAYGESLGYLSPEGGAKEPMTVLVYDLGGGTFDVTLLHMAPGEFRTLATDGEVQLGGYDWDLAILDELADEMVAAGFPDPRNDPGRWARVYQAVVEAKLALSARTKTTFRVELEEGTFETSLSRQRFADSTADLLERTAYTTRHLLQTAGVTWNDVADVLLVGGATRMPMIVDMLAHVSGKQPRRCVNPDEAVARGAAIYAGYRLSDEFPEIAVAAMRIIDVNAHSLGVEGLDPHTGRKSNVILIPRNTPLPVSKTSTFCTERQNQRSIAIDVLEGEAASPEDCSRIGSTIIDPLPPDLPKGWPVLVTFSYRANGRLDVRAEVPDTDCRAELSLRRDTGLDRVGVDRWRSTVEHLPGFAAVEAAVEELLAESTRGGSPAASGMSGPVAALGATGAAVTEDSRSEPRTPDVQRITETTTKRGVAGGAETAASARSEGDSGTTARSVPKLGKGRPRVTPGMLLKSQVQSGAAKSQPGGNRAFEPSPQRAMESVPSIETPDADNGRSATGRYSPPAWVPTPLGFAVPRWSIAATGFVVFSVLGLVIGYLIVLWLFPESALLKLL